MQKKHNFTAERIAGFKCESGKSQTIYWDAKTPSLGLRVTPKGAKSYIFETKLHGTTLRVTIGDVRTWGIGQAQSEATRLKYLTDQGIDPREQKRQQLASAKEAEAKKQRQETTFDEAWHVYINARKSKWGERSLLDHMQVVSNGISPGPLYSFLQIRLSDITGERVCDWLEIEAKIRPTRAGLAFRLLRAFINWCIHRHSEFKHVVDHNACGKKGREHLPKQRVKKDCLQREQLAGWFAEVRKIKNPVISAYLQVLLLTGARREEIAGLTWDCVDFQWNTLTIRDKVEEEGIRIIPLTPYVKHLLMGLPRRNQWVFSSPRAKSGRLQEPRIQHNLALITAGIPHIQLHGLRRTFKTQSEWVEVPTGIVAQIMGHKPSATAEKHYTQRPVDLLRLWHSKIEQWFLDQAEINFVPPKERIRVVTTN